MSQKVRFHWLTRNLNHPPYRNPKKTCNGWWQKYDKIVNFSATIHSHRAEGVGVPRCEHVCMYVCTCQTDSRNSCLVWKHVQPNTRRKCLFTPSKMWQTYKSCEFIRGCVMGCGSNLTANASLPHQFNRLTYHWGYVYTKDRSHGGRGGMSPS